MYEYHHQCTVIMRVHVCVFQVKKHLETRFTFGVCTDQANSVTLLRRCVSHLCDPWVCALAVDAVVLQPLVLRVGAVLLEGAAIFSFTPNTSEQRVSLQAQTTASTLSITLV